MGYTLQEEMRPGEFNPEMARLLNVPCGPLWSKLQKGEEVLSTDGKIIKPSQVMGEMRKGRKFSFVTDTKYLDSIKDEVKGSDLFICEGMFEKGMEQDAEEKKHMTCTQAAKIALDAEVKKMGLIHYSPRYTDYELKKLLKDAQEVFPNTFLTKDKMSLTLEYES